MAQKLPNAADHAYMEAHGIQAWHDVTQGGALPVPGEHGDGELPPLDTEAETKTLGVLLTTPAAFDYLEVERLGPGDFHDIGHQRIFTTLRAMKVLGHPTEAITLELRERGWLESCGGPEYVGKLITNAPIVPEDVKFWSERVSAASAKRALYAIGSDIAKAACNGIPVPELMQEAATRIKDLEARAVPADDVALMSFADLVNGSYPMEFHVEGVMVKGEVNSIVAPQKGMKTTIGCVDQGLSIAAAVPFLGHFPCNQANVLILSGESGLRTLAETATRIARAKGILQSDGERYLDIPGFTLSTWLPQFDNAQDIVKLGRMIERASAQVVYIDPIYLTLGSYGDDVNNQFSVGQALKPVIDLAASMGVTLSLVMHTRKNVPIGEMPQLDWIAHAGFGQIVRQWFLMNRRAYYEPGTGEHRLWGVCGGSAGHGGAWGIDIYEGLRIDHGGRCWAPKVRQTSEVIDEAEQSRELAKVEKKERASTIREQQLRMRAYEVLEKHGPMTLTRLRGELKVSGSAIKVAIDWLLECGEVVQADVKTDGGTFPGFQVSRSDKVGQGRIVRPSPG